MGVQSHLNRFIRAKELLKTFLDENNVTTSTNSTIEQLAEKLPDVSVNADKVDGWHLDVKTNGSEPEAGIIDTITIVGRTGG